MKRTAWLVLILLVVTAVLYACAEEVETYTSGDYTYILAEDGSALITNGVAGKGDLVIPTELDSHPVKGIGDRAYSLQRMTSVTISDTITDIGDNPWLGCSKLTTIYVSPRHPSLAVIDNVLYSKTDKRLVWYPLSREGEFTVPQGIQRIGGYAFGGCKGLTSILLPDSLTSIGESAFTICSNLVNIAIPASVIEIGTGAFSGCNSMLIVTVAENSYAEQYCIDNNLKYRYESPSLDWLNN